MAGKRKKHSWQVSVTFVPFESEGQREQAYRQWVRLFLIAKRREVGSRRREKVSRKTVAAASGAA